MQPIQPEPDPTLMDRIAAYPLLDALLECRSRRFGRGLSLSSPLEYTSGQAPAPLSEEEEAALAFAACGITGYALGDLPYQPGPQSESSSGNIMAGLIGRTIASGDALSPTQRG